MVAPLPPGFLFKTTPMRAQHEALSLSADRKYFGLYMAPGLGKTKVVLDTVARWYAQGKVDGMLFLTENGVHRALAEDEVSAHWPEVLPFVNLVWDHPRHTTKAWEALLSATVGRTAPGGRCVLMWMGYPAFITPSAQRAVRLLYGLNKGQTPRRIVMVCDESTNISSPSARRTASAWAWGKKSAARRVLTGSPVDEGPLKVYAPSRFLHPGIFDGWSSHEFRAQYAVLRKIEVATGHAGRTRMVDIIARGHDGRELYRNLPNLMERLRPHSFFAAREDYLDLPPRTYQRRPFTLNSAERSRVKELQRLINSDEIDDLMAAAAAAEERLDHHLTAFLRLHQASSGFRQLTGDVEGDGVEWLSPLPSRLLALKAACEEISQRHKIIVWTRFSPDKQLVLAKAGELLGRSAVGIADWREFQHGAANMLVANPQEGGKGYTFTAAHYAIYYSHFFSWLQRRQSQDRIHRAGLTHPVTYIDLVAEDSQDEKILSTKEYKREFSEYFQRQMRTQQGADYAG